MEIYFSTGFDLSAVHSLLPAGKLELVETLAGSRMTQEELAIFSGVMLSLERIANTLERLAADYALVNKLRIEMCPGCGQKVDPEKGFIIHTSGCTALWPEGSPPEI